MINISGHFRNERTQLGFCNMDIPLMVNCCGKQIFQTQDYFCNREKGRLDYQIIYVFRGEGHYFIDHHWITLAAGNIVLYRPTVPQFYSYFAKEKPEIYWIHFTGNQCEELLKKYDIRNCYLGENQYLKLLFQDIINELQLKKPQYEDIILHDFCLLLCSISRSFCSLSKPYENNFSIDRLLLELNSKYADNWTLSTMADYCKLSKSYFSHTFRKRMGVSPVQYLNTQRIEKAKEFLLSNSMSISTIARLVGFDDPLYFSRVFKKHTGIAPQMFYQKVGNANTPEWFLQQPPKS